MVRRKKMPYKDMKKKGMNVKKAAPKPKPKKKAKK